MNTSWLMGIKGHPTHGVKQGCPTGSPLSPLLFSLYINDMGRDISEGIGGALKGNGVNGVSYMLYVDDLTTYDPVGLAGQMQIMLNRLRAYAVRKGLTLNTPELVMHLNNGSRSRSSLTTFKYRNVALPQKGQFEYLGTLAYKQRKKATQAAKTLPTTIKEKRIPRAKAPCIPSTKNRKINGDQEGYCCANMCHQRSISQNTGL